MKGYNNTDYNRMVRCTGIIKKLACIGMSCVLTMGMAGCGRKTADKVPELLEPVSTNEAYRPVTYGDIGRIVIKTGTVVPTDYCYYYDTSVTLGKVYVNVGDTVKKGTVLAESGDGADVSSDEDADISDEDILDDAEEGSSADTKKYSHDIKQKIFEQNQIELDWKIKACEEIGDRDGANEARTEKAVNAENNRYDNLLYEYELKKQKEADEEKEKQKTSGTLKASHGGYVTFAKKVSGSENTVNGGENVVVVSDFEEPYIEITGESYKKDTYEMYKNMYTVVDGKKYEIEEYRYSNQEIAMAQSMSSMPYTRFQLKGVKNPEKILRVGVSISLYFSTSDAKNVLTVGNDSIYEENGQSFVYVKTETSQKERRNIETGASDANYTEVVSGLSEGDLVYYASDAVMPSDYMEYNVSLNSYTKTANAESFSVQDLNSVSYVSPCDGRFDSISIKKGQSVKKGDLLFVIDSGGGTAAVKDIDIQIQDENQSYDSEMKEYDDQIIDLNSQIDHYQKNKVATPTDAENTLYMAEQLMCQRNVAQYNKELVTYIHNEKIKNLSSQKEKLNKNNDGSGKISVYAEQDGKVLSIDADTDSAVKEGQNLCTIGGEDNKILVMSISEGKLGINQKVTIVNKSNNNEKITGICVGSTGDSGKSYIETDSDGNVHITKCSGDDELRYYIKPDDDKVLNKPKSYKISYPTASYENVVMIPTNMIYHESSKNNSSEYDYVWLIQGEELVKQYVTLGESSKNQTIILTGLSEGDVIAKETVSSKVQSPDTPGSSDSEKSDTGNSDSDGSGSAADGARGDDQSDQGDMEEE